jgi:type III secretion system YscQ/HrcQ family protein
MCWSERDATMIRARQAHVRPFRWEAVRRVSRLEAALLGAVARQLAPERPEHGAWRSIDAALSGALGGAAPRLEVGVPYTFPPRELAARVAGIPSAMARVVRADGRGFAVVVEATLAARLAAAVLGAGSRELAAPRAATPAERGVLAFLVAAALDARGASSFVVDAIVDDVHALAPLFADPSIVGVEGILYAGEARGRVRFFMPESLLTAAPPARPAGGERLGRMAVRLEIVAGHARVAARELAQLSPRDVVLLDRWSVGRNGQGVVRLACGKGSFGATLAGGTLTVTSAWDRGGEIMTKSADPSMVEELPVELACRLAEITLTARDVLDLAPGAIVPLGKPPGTGVELVSGGRVVARGELVEVEGELGVRVLEVPT